MLAENKDLEKKLIAQKNKYRGAVAKLKSRAFVPDRKSLPPRDFRGALRRLYLESRESLAHSQFAAFNEWIEIQNIKLLPELFQAPIGYDELNGVIEVPKASVETEIAWIAERLRVRSGDISSFRHQANIIEELSFSGENEAAIELLKIVDLQFGASFWSIQLRTALEHQAGGLERQKKYTGEVRNIYKRGLLNFITFNTSVRNEDRTTFSKFKSDTAAKIAGHKYYSEPIKNYVAFRLLGDSPETIGELCDILRVEQSHSIVDIYETFVRLAQEVCVEEMLSSARLSLQKAMQRLNVIDDFRLRKISAHLGVEGASLDFPRRSTEVLDLFFGGDYRGASRAARKLSQLPKEVWGLIYTSFVSKKNIGKATDVQKLVNISSLIRSTVFDPPNFVRSHSTLSKLALNFSAFNSCSGLLAFLDDLLKVDQSGSWRPHRISLNSPTLGVEDGSYLSDKVSAVPDVGLISLTALAYGMFEAPDDKKFLSERFTGTAFHLFRAAGYLKRKQYENAACEVAKVDTNTLTVLRVFATPLRISVLRGTQDKSGLVEFVAKEIANNFNYMLLLPPKDLLGGMQWSDFKTVSNPIASPLALHWLWLDDEKESTASLLRFATGKALKRLGVSRPSELIDGDFNLSRSELIYFLNEVCIPKIIDVARILKGTEEVMAERQAICATLRTLDPENSGKYADEVMEISNQRALADGQWLVDRTRIHVDTESFRKWAAREFSEGFSRYKDLLALSPDANINLDNFFQDVESSGLAQQESLTLYGEADSLLYAMLRRAAEEFLNNGIFGLDFYLSKRIRHQSFIGLIRGPLEFSRLITTKKLETKEYQRNDYWVDKFGSGPDALKGLEKAFSLFASHFDEILTLAKEHRFHVRSAEKPDGLMFLDINPKIMAIAKTVAGQDRKIFDFVETLLLLFWPSLEFSLNQTRIFIAKELKTKIADAFDQFRAAARKYVGGDPAFLQFDTAIGQCSTEVQRKLDEASAWFVRMDIKAQMRIFTLDQIVKVAIDSALRCQRAFEPVISCEVESGENLLRASTLVFVHDVLFVGLDNARAHSGYKNPNILIKVVPNIAEETLSIRVESDSKPQQRVAREHKVFELRKLVDSNVVDKKTRREGESGFIKIAAVVRQSEKGRIDFGFIESGRFFLDVVLSMPVKAVEIESQPT